MPETSSAPSADSSTVRLAWADAQGPVAGYAVFVQRDGGAFGREKDVAGPTAEISGPPGQTASVIVAAFDANRTLGPLSSPSPVFTFPAPVATTAANASGASAASSGSPKAFASALPAAGDALVDGGDPNASEAPTGAVLHGALVWEAGDALRITNAALETELLFSRPAPGAGLSAVADFDGDGVGDLLWVAALGAVSYTPGASLLLGAAETPVVDLGSLRAGERVLGAADFDGDTRGDLLVARADGAIDAWFNAPGGIEIVRLGTADGARVAGIGDFDGNGVADVAWREAQGDLVLWLMDGSGVGASVGAALAGALEVIAAGDFDGDAVAELAVRDADGNVLVFRPLSTPPALESTGLANAQAWRAVGAADLDRDGIDEIVLAGASAVRIAGTTADEVLPVDPTSPWLLLAPMR